MTRLLSFLGARRAFDREVAELRRLETVELKKHIQALEHTVLNQKIRVELQAQALHKAESDVTYWRKRAELFIDQVGLRERIIASPTMTEPEPAPESPTDSVFNALGRSEINTQPPATATAVLGVDAQAATAAVKELLDRTGTR